MKPPARRIFVFCPYTLESRAEEILARLAGTKHYKRTSDARRDRR